MADMVNDEINIFKRIEEAVKGKIFKRHREPPIPHQVRHGKWWKLKSSGELKSLAKVKALKDRENPGFLIKSHMGNDEN